MSDLETSVVDAPEELVVLKARADLLGVTYHPSIGVEKLRDKINSVVTAGVDTPASVAVLGATESSDARRARKRKEATELLRIRVTCMNPAKKEWDGEIFTSGNSVIGSHTKFVPFNDADDGWHVPRIIYEQINQRQCQVFTTIRDARGNTTRKGKLIKEFAVEILPPLTPKELAELAQRQAMAKTIE